MPTMEIIKSISEIKLPFLFPDSHECSTNDFAFHHETGLIALRTEDYYIQFFSLFNNMEISQVQVCARNFQPVDDVTVFVALSTFFLHGSMMSTVDVKLPKEDLGGLVTMKLWNGGSRLGEYTLSTVIFESHSNAQISAIAFRPVHSMAVWVNSSNYPQAGHMHHKYEWRCQSVGSYKNMPMVEATFSPDGSVLAVAAETTFTLWDPDKNVFIAVIGNTVAVAVWSLSKLSIRWSYQISAEAICTAKDGS